MGNLSTALDKFRNDPRFSFSAENDDAQEAYELFVMHSGSGHHGLSHENLPPVQVVINDSLAYTAADQIKDNQLAAKELSKKLVTEFLTSRSTATQCGMFLGSLFTYESVLQPTRELVYWSLSQPYSYNPILWQAKSGLLGAERETSQMIASLSERWLLHPLTHKQVVAPLLIWTMKQEDISIQPLADLIIETIPEYREVTTQSIKGAILDYIHSGEATELAREGIMQYLSKRSPRAKVGEAVAEPRADGDRNGSV